MTQLVSVSFKGLQVEHLLMSRLSCCSDALSVEGTLVEFSSIFPLCQ